VQGIDSNDGRTYNILHRNAPVTPNPPLWRKARQNDVGRHTPTSTQDQRFMEKVSSNSGAVPRHRGSIPKRGNHQVTAQHEEERVTEKIGKLCGVNARQLTHNPPLLRSHIGTHNTGQRYRAGRPTVNGSIVADDSSLRQAIKLKTKRNKWACQDHQPSLTRRQVTRLLLKTIAECLKPVYLYSR
jgi:hypothetical protein